MTLTVGQTLNRRYRIDGLLGEGGFGAVYKAWDLSLARACAVKENFDTSEAAQRQFTREATTLASLSHPNLPRVTDYFFIPGQGQYLVMDFVDGVDLGQLVRKEGPVPPERALSIIRQVADALEYLHSRKPPVLHRDIKPGNIKITPDGRAVLVDFGLVKMYGPQMETTIGARAVTPGYSPPEQYGQGTTDPRTDIYALAATLYTLLTARLPPESVQRYGTDDLVLPHQVDNTIPPVLSAAVGRAMALNPSQRFQSIAEMRSVLWPDQTVRTVSPGTPGRRWARLLIAGLLLAGCLGVASMAVGGMVVLPFVIGVTETQTPEAATRAILLQDNLTAPNGGWQVGTGKNSQRLFDNGQYTIRVTQPNLETWGTAAATGLTDLHAEVTVTSTGYATDEAYGLVCDLADDTHFYYMGITSDGYYAIIKREGGQASILTDASGKWVQSMLYPRNLPSYRLGADCGADGTLAVYANGQLVASAKDRTYTSGQVGLFVRTFDQAPAEVRFADLIVTALH